MKTTLERFMDKVEKTETCWNWTGYTHPQGYGQFWNGNKNIMAHWFLLDEHPKNGLECCHTCDNRKCVRPSHIFIGTRSDNMMDCSRKGRLRYKNGLLVAHKVPRDYCHKGSKNHQSKLTEEVVGLIKGCSRRYGLGAILAKHFKVSETVISGIWKGHRWTHISPSSPERSESFLKCLNLWKENDK